MDFFRELRRRRVIRVALVYAVTAWIIMQVVAVVSAPLHLPGWFGSAVIILLAIGFPLALVLTWAFELSPEGMRRTRPAEEGGSDVKAPGQSKLDYAIVGLLVVAIGWMIYGSMGSGDKDMPVQVVSDEPAALPPDVLHNSIAVLPFENFSPNPDDAYFAAGIHEELLNQLAKIKALSIIARTTVSRYADSDLSVPDIGRELNVGTVMEGSVRYAGNRVRITAQLIDVATGAHLWSEAYDRDLTDIFAIQSDIALNITDAMKVQFSIAERQAIEKPLTDSAEAYTHYVKALSRLTQPVPDLDAIQADLDEAIAADPNFATALALKAYFFGAAMTLLREDRPLTPEAQAANAAKATQYADRALAIDKDQGGAWLARSYMDAVNRDWQGVFDNSKRAYELNPNQTQIIWEYGVRHCATRRVDECIALFDRAIALNPHDINLPLFSSMQALFVRRWQDADRYARQVITLAPDYYRPYAHLAVSAAWTGDREAALKLAKESEARLGSSRISDTFLFLFTAYKKIGADADAARIRARLEDIDKTRPLNDGEWALIFAAEGNLDKAFAHLNRMVDRNFPMGHIYGLFMYPGQPWLENLRPDPRFEEVRARLNPPK